MTSAIRIEHDSLGQVKVPAGALYGAQTQRAVENFRISGRTAHPALIRAYLRIKKAAALANHCVEALDETIAQLIVRAADQLLAMPETEWPAAFPVDPFQAGAGTSQNMNLNEVLANVASQLAGEPLGQYRPVHPNDHVNRSQSTNDTFPTAMRLALLEASSGLESELLALAAAFSVKARDWDGILKSARTHLQDAVPMRLGRELGAYARTVARAADGIGEGRQALRELGIGGSAAGTGLNVPPGYTEEILKELRALTGEELRLAPDLVEAMQSQRPVTLYSSQLRLAAIELTRICNDLRLLASGPSTGLAELVLPAAQPGSSIMPGKVNPSILEMTNQVLYAVLGRDHSVALASQAGQLELNVMMPLMAHELLEATSIFTRALESLRTRCVDGLEPNRERLARYFESTPQVATALSPLIGYEATAGLVQEAIATGRSVLELASERGLATAAQIEEIRRAF